MLNFTSACSIEGRPLSYAFQELSTYLRRMLPSAQGEISVRLAVCSESCPSSNAIRDPALDDWYKVDASSTDIHVCASNERSILLGVYRLLHVLGCRFLMPGKKHEFIPHCSMDDLNVHFEQSASFRHRGVCIEGANSIENILDFIDWLPKIGCNSFFVQHLEPESFLKNWYTHRYNPLLTPEDISEDQYQHMYRQIDDAISLRGLLHHRVGHGWTCKAIGYEHVCTKVDGPTDDQRSFLAEVNGRRDFWQGIPSNTNLCYSNPEARHAFVNAVTTYSAQHPEVDFLHVWLADEYNNICECEACRQTTLSDQYVSLLNEIDAALTAKSLKTHIVFLLYQELLWPPLHEKLQNPERFTLMFAPISRTFEKSYADREELPSSVPDYRRNHIKLPATIEENLAFLRAWQSQCKVDAFVYDYPLGRAHYGDLGYCSIAHIIAQDIKQLPALGLNGYLSCQEFRVGLPNTFPNYVMAHLLWDSSLSFEQLREEYFSALYGKHYDFALRYLHELSQLSSADYFNGIGARKNNDMAQRFTQASQLVQKAAPKIQQEKIYHTNLHKIAWELLDYHAGYCKLLLRALIALANGRQSEIEEKWLAVMHYIRQNEMDYQPYFDVYRLLEVATKYTGFALDVPR